MWKKAETIYTMREKGGKEKCCPSRKTEPAIWGTDARAACYVSVNGIAMPAMRYKSLLCLAA